MREEVGRTRAAIAAVSTVEVRLVQGEPVAKLLEEVGTERAILLAIGVHEESRLSGIAFGRVATAVLHKAPCSVLAARAPHNTEVGFPHSIVVGYDGSRCADLALARARGLATCLGSSLTVLIALDESRQPVDDEHVRRIADGGVLALVEDERGPVEALVKSQADLLVVGSRGLHGIRALGSVSERVSHRARCSVLVIR